MDEVCAYCGLPNPTRPNAFFEEPVCQTCFHVWFDNCPATGEELRELSRKEQGNWHEQC